MKKCCFITWLILLFTNTMWAQSYIGNAEDIDQIKANIEAFSEYVMASDYHNIAASYTKDGKIMPNGTKIIEGYDEIKQRWTLPEGTTTSYHKILPEEINVIGEYAYDYGYYEGATTRADGTRLDWKGKYVIVWKKVDGIWKIYLDIWNRVN